MNKKCNMVYFSKPNDPKDFTPEWKMVTLYELFSKLPIGATLKKINGSFLKCEETREFFYIMDELPEKQKEERVHCNLFIKE